jgi:xylan 1,4-beta-xylosidase
MNGRRFEQRFILHKENSRQSATFFFATDAQICAEDPISSIRANPCIRGKLFDQTSVNCCLKLPNRNIQFEEMKFSILCCLILFSSLQIYSQEKKEILFADVTIYVEGGKYYLTGTKGGKGPEGFSVLESTDLRNWIIPKGSKESLGMILTKGSHTFGTTGFWAPQIVKTNNGYYLTYTANEQTALARSNTLTGPYVQEKIGVIDSSAKNIDSYIFRDDDGKYFLYHVRFDNGNYLWVGELDLEKGNIKPGTLKKCFSQTESWEATPNYQSGPIMEGPTVVKLENKYYLFYSANHFKNIDYAVGYAVADSPCGPWIKQKNSPIIHRSVVGENGSGHGDLFKGLDGEMYYVYHVHFSDHETGPRKTRIVPLVKKWDAAKSIYQFSADGNKVIIPTIMH